LKKYAPIWINIHFNHPKEITKEVRHACNMLVDNGFPLGSQTVLLKGINDNWITMKRLMYELVKMRVRPYYMYHCDLAEGTQHFRTTIDTGINIIKHLRGHITGLAVPNYVIDCPGGGGKIPIVPDYCEKMGNDTYMLQNYEGKSFMYKEEPIVSVPIALPELSSVNRLVKSPQ
jgi:lysine 2,3-aminomutase